MPAIGWFFSMAKDETNTKTNTLIHSAVAGTETPVCALIAWAGFEARA
jgi:hypothetical protein